MQKSAEREMVAGVPQMLAGGSDFLKFFFPLFQGQEGALLGLVGRRLSVQDQSSLLAHSCGPLGTH